MYCNRRGLVALLAVTASGLSAGVVAHAQSAPQLYDPQPPADSAYVRVLLVSQEGPVDVAVDGRVRIRKLNPGDASDYMVIPNGQHTIALHLAGKSKAHTSTTLEVVRGRAISVAFTTLKPDTAPLIFEDKANSNKLKAALTVYHLDSGSGNFDVFTGDKSTKVFSNLAFGTSSSKQVNPISIELLAVPVDSKSSDLRADLAMSPGGAYSLLLLPTQASKSKARIIQNQIERYTGP